MLNLRVTIKKNSLYTLLFAMGLFLYSVAATAQGYSDYQKKYKEWYGVSLGFPEMAVRTFTEPFPPFIFGSIPMPISMDGNAQKMEGFMCEMMYEEETKRYCIYMKSLMGQPYNTAATPMNSYSPTFRDILFENCDVPASSWSQYEDPKDFERLRNEYSKKHIRYVTDAGLKERTNSDTICVVQIPNMKKVKCLIPTVNPSLQESYDECYGVDFYNSKRNHSVQILVFLSTTNGNNIDDFLKEISAYIKFDKE